MINHLPGTKTDKCAFCPPELNTIDSMVCVKCDKGYCIEHSSKICSIFCQDCFQKLTLIVDKYVRQRNEYDPIVKQNINHSSMALRLKLDGIDWVWYTASVNLLTEAEFFIQFEFHRFMVSIFEHLYTIRTIEDRNIKLAQARKTLKIPLNPQAVSLDGSKKIATKVIDLAATLRAQGLPEGVIQAMLRAGGIQPV